MIDRQTILNLNAARDDGLMREAMAAAGPYANICISLQRDTPQNPITQFLQVGLSSWRPTNSVKGLKAMSDSVIIINPWTIVSMS